MNDLDKDFERSGILAKAMGEPEWSVKARYYSNIYPTEYHNLYASLNMHLAWWVLNWALTKDSGIQWEITDWLGSSFSLEGFCALADARRLWLNKIYELVVAEETE